MKIKFNSDDKVPLGKMVNILMCLITVKSVFEINGMFYPKNYLHSCYLEYDNNKCIYV